MDRKVKQLYTVKLKLIKLDNKQPISSSSEFHLLHGWLPYVILNQLDPNM